MLVIQAFSRGILNGHNYNLAMNTIEEARCRHDTWATASDALGRCMTAGAIF